MILHVCSHCRTSQSIPQEFHAEQQSTKLTSKTHDVLEFICDIIASRLCYDFRYGGLLLLKYLNRCRVHDVYYRFEPLYRGYRYHRDHKALERFRSNSLEDVQEGGDDADLGECRSA